MCISTRCCGIFCIVFTDQREAFQLFDRKGDGKVDSNQLGDILRALGLNPTEADVAKIRGDIDPTGIENYCAISP